jgi:hypothetical protein
MTTTIRRGRTGSTAGIRGFLSDALRTGGPAPIPVEEILEVSRVTIEVADASVRWTAT